MEIERFMYQLKTVATRKRVILFVIYNLSIPQKRADMRPTLKDYPSDSYYRLFDVVQFTYRPAECYEKLYDKAVLELIWAKGLPTDLAVRMYEPEEVTSVFEHQQHDLPIINYGR